MQPRSQPAHNERPFLPGHVCAGLPDPLSVDFAVRNKAGGDKPAPTVVDASFREEMQALRLLLI